MQKKKKSKNEKNNVIPFLPQTSSCLTCHKKVNRMYFCEEHFLWFKEGLIDKNGKKPKDFQKKYTLFLKKYKKSA